MQAKTERFEMRLEQITLDRLDGWRARQSNPPSRAEAARRLIEAGLEGGGSKEVQISDGEKLILFMLRDLYKHSKIKGEIDPDFVISALVGGHHWGLGWQFSGIFHGYEDDPAAVSEVVDVLDMWSFLESGYARLSAKEKARITRELEPLGNDVKFLGFDGNNESAHLSITHFLIRDLERFQSFKGRDLNSHMPSIEGYRQMLRVFEPIKSTLTRGELSASQIIDILKARWDA